MLERLWPMHSPRGVTARYALLAGLQELAIALPLPVLVLHVTGRGLDLGLIGIAFAVRAVLVVLLEIPTGGMADAIGRKPTALLSQALTMASYAALLFVGGPLTLMLYALLQGVGAALHSGALDAWYVDALKRADPEAPLQKNLAAIDVAQSVCFLGATALGGYLPALTASWDLPWPLAGFGIALFAGVLVRALVWLLTALLVVESGYEDRGGLAGLKAVPEIVGDALTLARRTPAVPFLLLAAAASGLAIISLETFWQPVAALHFGSDPEQSGIYGIMGVLMGGAVTLGSLAVLRYGDRMPGGSAALAGVSQLVKGAAMVLMAFAAGGTGLALGLTLGYFALATNNVPHDTLLNESIPDERRSVMLSVNSLTFFLGIALASAVLGPLAAAAGPKTALALGGGATALASLAYLGVALGARRRSAPLPSGD